MKFSFQNSGKSDEQIASTIKNIKEYVSAFPGVFAQKKEYDNAETSINLPFDTSVYERCESLTRTLVTDKLKYVVVVGIGGSLLGTKTVYDAMMCAHDIYEPVRSPRMLFAETVDPEQMDKMLTFLQTSVKTPEEIIICVVSKSGGTTETVANVENILHALKNTVPSVHKRLVVITTDGSPLDSIAKKLDCSILPHEAVGGRFSVFSSVGVFPLLCAGIDVKSLLKGAQTSRDKCISADPAANPALISAAILYAHHQDGIRINDNFFFHTELESLGKWYRQLMGESVGKDGKGITPTVSIGSTDLHSMGQLYYGGPRDKVMTVVTAARPRVDVALPSTLTFGGLVKNIEGKSASEIMKAISDAVLISYAQEGIPSMHIELDTIDEFSIGEFMQFKMIEMMYLGKLMGVNTFDQPHVEIYKKELRQILAEKH